VVVRKRKKKNKLRARRTFGKGDTKNNRGAGVRGGRGRAGSKKHNKMKYLSEVGTLRKLKPKKKYPSLNLDDINKLIEKISKQKESEKHEGLLVFDGKKLGIRKILSVGELKQKVFFKNVSLSKQALEKVEKAGAKFSGETKKDIGETK